MINKSSSKICTAQHLHSTPGEIIWLVANLADQENNILLL